MLTESFVASITRPDTVPSHVQHKDAGIYFHELQPLPSIKSVLKKSSTVSNCLAVSSTHVFAAQADKAVVHVYNIERGTQECLVPFPQKITSLALIGNGASNSVLVLGDELGRVVLWELATGRQVSLPSAHLQAVTCLAIDPTNNFLLSGSADTNVHVWSISILLSFASIDDHYSGRNVSAPLQTLSNHRGTVTSLAMGHSFRNANIAVSASEDNSCIVWNYRTASLLRTFLLTSTPLSLGLDPADRGFFAGLADGSVQMVDFYNKATLENSIHNGTVTVTEPPKTARWEPREDATPVSALAITYDGTKVLTGHESGKIYVRDVGTGKLVGDTVAALLGPVTNITMLPVQGLVRHDNEDAIVPIVTKPKPVALLKVSEDGGEALPESYTFHACFTEALPLQAPHSRRQRPRLHGLSRSTTEDVCATLLADGYSRDLLDQDLAALQTGDGSDIARSTVAAASSNGENELTELHRLLARKTQESLELKKENEQLGKDLAKMLQTECDRKVKKSKQSENARANELRRKAHMEDSQADATGNGPLLESNSDSEIDLSIGG